MNTHMHAETFADIAEEFVDRIRFAESQRDEWQREQGKQRGRVAMLESFLREHGFTRADAEQAWRDKGYGL